MIRVQPAAAVRTEFARWAVAQRPKLAMASECAFGVPEVLFRDMPEELLIGALIDGKRYVPVAEAAPVAADDISGRGGGDAGAADAPAPAREPASAADPRPVEPAAEPAEPAAEPAEPAEPATAVEPAPAARKTGRTKAKTTGGRRPGAR